MRVMPMTEIRRADPTEANTCAAILNAWIDATPWMPRVHPVDDVERHYRETVFAKRDVWVFGRPLRGYISLDPEAQMIMALYAAEPGHGVGKALVDHAKTLHDRLELWTFVANTGARRFYAREGFAEVTRSEGDNEEGLPDILFRWERAA